MSNGSTKTVWIVISFILVILLVSVAYLGKRHNEIIAPTVPPENEAVVCTMDAKMCPDGSYVGRVGPNCEFAQCPAPTTPMTGWKLKTDTTQKISYQTIEKLPTMYISMQDAPTIQVLNEPYQCTAAGKETENAGRTEKIFINGNEYCVTKIVEGAAGSTYTQYAFVSVKAKRTVALTFTTRAPQCLNYDEPNTSSCQKEQSSFSAESIADKIIQSISFL